MKIFLLFILLICIEKVEAQICFNLPVSFSVAIQPNSVSSVDFNSDGKVDLVVANGGSNNISILFGLGNGSFGRCQLPYDYNFILLHNARSLAILKRPNKS